jgi:3-hydroxyisobutyrate dehydrogenase-like beta-hydroxyacid dehydrogenase
MGSAMFSTLCRAGFRVLGYDIRPERVELVRGYGADGARDIAEVVNRCDRVLLSLRSSEQFIAVAEEDLLPNARDGQVFVDLGTTSAPETRRLNALFAAKRCHLIDAPVSGGPTGSERGMLRIFIGGNERVVAQNQDVFDALGDPEHTAYCGPSGSGQVVKGVNQLAMGLGAAAYLEAIAFGIRSGVPLEPIRKSVGGSSGWRAELDGIATQIANGQGAHVYTKFPEFPYFLEQARDAGFALPITEALFAFLDSQERNVRDNMNRPTVSHWEQLTSRGRDHDET